MRVEARITLTAVAVVTLLLETAFAADLVSGRVVDGSGSPLGGVTVDLLAKDLSTTTGADGTFEFQDDATVAPSSLAFPAVSTVKVYSGVLRIAAGQHPARVRARLYDPRGRLVRTILDGGVKPEGTLQTPLFARDENSIPIALGMYVLEARIDNAVWRFRVTRLGLAGRTSVSLTSPNAQAKALAAVDTLRLSKTGCTTKSVTIEQYGESAGDIGLVCGNAGPQVPRLDEFLPNDDMPIPSSGTVRYAKPGGSGVGGTTEGAAGDIQATVTASAAGDYVVCLKGYYNLPTGLSFPVGVSATKPVTVMAKPGEWAVLCRDAQFTGIIKNPDGSSEGAIPGKTGSTSWELYDKVTNTWRIPATGSGRVVGCFFEAGQAHYLLQYFSLAQLMASRDAYSGSNTNYYFSGVAREGGHVYLRLDRPNWGDVAVVDAQNGAWPNDGRYMQGLYPTEPKWFVDDGNWKNGKPIIGLNPDQSFKDPNTVRIYVAPHELNGNTAINGGPFIRVGSGINTMGYWLTVGQNANQVEFHRGSHYAYWGSLMSASARSDLTFHRCRFFCGEWRLQGSMHLFKFGGPWESERNGFVALPPNGSSMTNVTFDNCTIQGYHEGVVGSKYIDKMRFVNCSFYLIFDELMQIPIGRTSRMEVGHCYMRDCPGGIGADQTGAAGTPANSTADPNGMIYYHHNLHDERCPRAGDQKHMVEGGPWSISHSSNDISAHKWYNNTIIFNPDDPPNRGMAMGHRNNDGLCSGVATEVFNNICIRHDTKRYVSNEGTAPANGDAAEDGMDVKNSSGGYNLEYRDYNLYYRDIPKDPKTGAFSDKKWANMNLRWFGANNPSFDYIRSNTGKEPGSSVFYGSAYWTESKNTGYAPGWETNGSDADPQIPSVSGTFPANRMDYRPQNTAATAGTSSSLSGTNWWSAAPWTSYGATPVAWDLAPSPYKGALDPNGTDMTVGVLNP